MSDIKDGLRRTMETEEDRTRRRIEEIEFLRLRGLATFEDEAEAFRLRRQSAKREFRRRQNGQRTP